MRPRDEVSKLLFSSEGLAVLVLREGVRRALEVLVHEFRDFSNSLAYLPDAHQPYRIEAEVPESFQLGVGDFLELLAMNPRIDLVYSQSCNPGNRIGLFIVVA